MRAVGQLGKEIGIARACRALEVPRATFYRRRKTALEVIRLRRDRDRLAERLRQAELIIEVQKKVFGLLDTNTDLTDSQTNE
jgi:hypothetical protein